MKAVLQNTALDFLNPNTLQGRMYGLTIWRSTYAQALRPPHSTELILAIGLVPPL